MLYLKQNRFNPVFCMKKVLILFIVFKSVCFTSTAQQIFRPGHHIQCYFTRPVDTNVARSEKAIALGRAAGDTVIAYINRAKYTLDILMYDFVEDSTWFEQGNIPNIALAINNAYARGVKIRWITNTVDPTYSPNTGIDSINKNIPVIHSPSGGNYGIMHNKIMIIDGRSSNPDDPIVWTGCMNWEPGQIDKDANNLVILQDSALAHAYLTEFNQMWGDTVEGGLLNMTNSKFGPNKKSIPKHYFTIDGKSVELWFSPVDAVNNHILSTMESAKTEVDLGVFEWSEAVDASEVGTLQSKGIYMAAIVDQYSTQYAAYTSLSNYLGPMLQTYFGTDSLFHNKYMIIDPCNMQAGPAVLTGSHNWTLEANSANDENTLVIHDSTIANIFYQAFYREFYSLGGTLVQHCVPLGIDETTDNNAVYIYPIPAHNYLMAGLNEHLQNTTYAIYNVMGQNIMNGKLDEENTNALNIGSIPAGIYVIKIQSGAAQFSRKFCKE